jgi:hypothetical protein
MTETSIIRVTKRTALRTLNVALMAAVSTGRPSWEHHPNPRRRGYRASPNMPRNEVGLNGRLVMEFGLREAGGGL